MTEYFDLLIYTQSLSTQKSPSSQLERHNSTVQDELMLDSSVYGLQHEETEIVMDEEEQKEEEGEEHEVEEHEEETEQEHEEKEHEEEEHLEERNDDRENVDPPRQVSVGYGIAVFSGALVRVEN